MDYTRLGNTGLQVSRICLGMMSYGDPARQEWALDRGRAEPIVRRAADAGVTFFDTADIYSAGASEEVTGTCCAKIFPSRDDYVLATKVFFPMGEGANDRGLSRKHIHARDRRLACGGSAPTTWTSTRSTAGTPRRRSRRRWRRCTTS